MIDLPKSPMNLYISLYRHCSHPSSLHDCHGQPVNQLSHHELHPRPVKKLVELSIIDGVKRSMSITLHSKSSYPAKRSLPETEVATDVIPHRMDSDY